MALIKCTECGKVMSDKAPACPNCGCPIDTVLAESQRIKAEIDKENQENEKKNQEKIRQKTIELESKIKARGLWMYLTLGIVIIISLSFVGLGIFKQISKNVPEKIVIKKPWTYNPNSPTVRKLVKERQIRLKPDAHYAAKNFVKERLLSPATASFQKYEEALIELLDDCVTYKIYGYVDSQNSYGAMIRFKWYVKLLYKNTYWKLLDIKIY